ncbi:hypothetical protein JNUCC64_21565 [Streptomyces sp. JNUCC 64]
MTHGPSAPADTPPSPDGDWDRRLADAFAVLLGRPLSAYDPDAVYAASAHGNLMHESEFERDPAWVRPAALSGAEPVVWNCSLFDDSVRTPVFDASGSVFEFPAGDAGSALPADFSAAVAAARLTGELVLGADLAPLVERYGVDLADPAFRGAWTVFFPRLVSDGTLLGALKAALDTGHRPEDLMESSADPDEEWEERLAAMDHPGIRDHLKHFCTDGDTGLMPLTEAELWASGLEEAGCETLAAWEDGHGQIDIEVVRLGPLLAGPAAGVRVR